MRALGIAEARAPSPGDALDVLGAAAAVVGIDTGLTHLAVQQGTPTVTICRAPAVFFRPWPHARAVVGDRCDDVCIAAETERAYNDVVDLRGLRWQPPTCPGRGALPQIRPTRRCPRRARSACCDTIASRSTRTRRVASTTRSLTASAASSRSTACARGTTSVATSCSPARTSGLARCSTSPSSRRTSRRSTTSTSTRSSTFRAWASW